MHARTVSAGNWWAKTRGETNSDWIGNYQNSLRVRHRDLIVRAVSSIAGATSILEVGSHCGPNLIRIAQECPQFTDVNGIDINADAVSAGNRWAQSLGLGERVLLEVGRIPQATASIPDHAVDIVLSCYALAYIAPEDLDATLYEMGRLAKRAVILAEPMGAQAQRPASMFSEYAEWAHDYHAATKWIGTLRACDVQVIDVNPPVDRLNGIFVARRVETSSLPPAVPTR